MTRSVSITRRLVVTVLLLELLSALALIVVVTVHERHVELKAFDATLVGAAESLMGAVQDAEDEGDNVLLDLRSVQLNRDAIYRVEDEHGRVLGSASRSAMLSRFLLDSPGFYEAKVGHIHYRFFVFHGIRIIDPGKPGGGTNHNISILYGMPVGRVWHEVIESIRFFVIATALLLGATAILMVWLVRRHLLPVHELAHEADRISSGNWNFDAPLSAKETVELRPLARALESALTRVHLSFEQQKRFTNDAAHELKTDVAIVKSSLQLLSMRKRTVDEYSEGLALSLDDFTRLESTVQKMLTLARLEQLADSDGPDQVQPACSIRDAVEEAVHQSKPFAELKMIEVTVDVVDEATVQLDRRDALLLCSNILVNALQHSLEGGKVQLTVTRHRTDIALTIKDWGEGISEEDRPYLFDPFYRGDVSRSRKSGSTGLGLSICKAICGRVGGSIEISNHQAGGALVTVTLPTSDPISISQ